MKVAVVGHVEWGRFIQVDHVPEGGEIVRGQEIASGATGGGAIAATELLRLNGSCMFFTSVGDDGLGRAAIEQLRSVGLEVFASVDTTNPTKEVIAEIDANNERTITTLGSLAPSGKDSTLPWAELKTADAVYFVSGDIAALQFARSANALVSTARVYPLIRSAGVMTDALVLSANDYDEISALADPPTEPGLIVTTNGTRGGSTNIGVNYIAEVVPEAEFVDTYGCGDSFAAGLTYALAKGLDIASALKLAAHSGAMATRRRGLCVDLATLPKQM